MSTYKATFTATAQVEIEVELEAPNQQDGIVQAHDDVRQSSPAAWRIVSVDTEKAVNTAFKLMGGTPVAHASEQKEPSLQPYKVCFFQNWIDANPEETLWFGDFNAAKNTALHAVRGGELAQYGNAIVVETGSCVTAFTAKSQRGGFEVIVVNNNDAREVTSWLSEKEANRFAVQASLQTGAKVCQVIDFTDRKKGPVVKRQIK